MKTNIDWNKFKLFYYVAKLKSFTSAAEVLNISQSSVSRSIQQLEYQLKCKLFERLPRGLILTKQAEALFDTVESVLDSFSRAEMLMLEEEEEPEGVLKVATTMAIATVWLIPHLIDFFERYPKLRLSIIGNDEELDLKTRQADVSIRPFIENHPELIQEPFSAFNLKLYASPVYLQKHGIPQSVQDLDRHRFIVFGYDAKNPYNDINWPLKLGMPKGMLREPFLCINTSAGMRQAAEAHLGIIALAREYPGIEKSHLVEILADVPKPTIPLYYVYPEHLKDSKRVRALGNYLKEEFSLKGEGDHIYEKSA